MCGLSSRNCGSGIHKGGLVKGGLAMYVLGSSQRGFRCAAPSRKSTAVRGRGQSLPPPKVVSAQVASRAFTFVLNVLVARVAAVADFGT